jgi:hypothetical protein
MRAYWIALGSIGLVTCADSANMTPTIKHEPVAVAVQGQPISIRARVSDDSGPLKAVTLFCTTSRDAAPFRIPMAESGKGEYAAVIPPNLFRGVSEITYYIEAMDKFEATGETPWYTVQVHKIESPASTGAAAPPGVSQARPATPTPPPPEKSKWVTPALLGGAAIVAGGVAYAVAGSGGGDSSDGGGGQTASYAGTYAGSSTTCFQLTGSNMTCSTAPINIGIDDNKTVKSDNLRPGTSMQTTLSGDSFLLTAPVNENGMTGEIRYLGAVSNSRIVGTVEGITTSASGKQGTYSGTFTAVKQ